MKNFSFTVSSSVGMHARPCALLAQKCTNSESVVTVKANDRTANGRNVLELMALNVKKGNVLDITVDGPDEERLVGEIEAILSKEINANKGLETLKIAFFGAKAYDKVFFSELGEDKRIDSYHVDINYISSRLFAETVSLAKGADAVCAFVNDELDREVLTHLNEYGIRLVLLRCAGFNNVDIDAAKEYGITVLRVPAYSPFAVAEHAMAILMEANRRLHKAYARIRENNFSLNGLMGIDLHNKVAGIIGTGRIGICMANICKGYGMKVIAWDAFPNQKWVDGGLLTYVEKEELYKQADLISIHAPLLPDTHHLINEEAIALMKDDAMLVNAARGGLVDTEALIAAMKKGKFHAVALDVYEGEDPNVYNNRSDVAIKEDITARLMNFPQVVISSHQAFFTREALQAIAVVTLENAAHYREGKDYGPAFVC